VSLGAPPIWPMRSVNRASSPCSGLPPVNAPQDRMNDVALKV
jgi:hypothetical protein